MQKSNKGKIYAFIGAICLIMYIMFMMIMDIKIVLLHREYSISYSIPWSRVVWSIGYIALAVFLWVGKKNVAFLFPSALFIIMGVMGIIRRFSIYSFLYTVIWILLFILLLINVIPSMQNLVKITRILWFVPAGIMLLAKLLMYIECGDFYKLDKSWIYLFFSFVDLAGFFFLTLWLRITMPVQENM